MLASRLGQVAGLDRAALVADYAEALLVRRLVERDLELLLRVGLHLGSLVIGVGDVVFKVLLR